MSEKIILTDEHRYFIKGERYHSVTTIIKEFLPNYNPSEYLADKGTMVHKTLQYFDEDDLAHIPAESKPYLKGYKKFLSEWKPDIVGVEKVVYDRGMKVAGTIDRLYKFKLNKNLFIVDIKTGVPKPADLIQTGGYEYLYRRMEKVYKTVRGILYLNEGSYDFKQLPGYMDNSFDHRLFISMANVYLWKRDFIKK